MKTEKRMEILMTGVRQPQGGGLTAVFETAGLDRAVAR
jgi:hypothetical protein